MTVLKWFNEDAAAGTKQVTALLCFSWFLWLITE